MQLASTVLLPPAAAAALLAWFAQHRRDLPWRRTTDPYAIWVSEIMLQQTRVAAVLGHYARWMERFPTVAALAAAPEDEVLALWSGLGYYRRARMLHRGAQVVVAEQGGTLPRTAAELRTLPGIGAYTAAAVASIAFGEAVAVVDGNVERVVTRLLGLLPAAAARQEPPLALLPPAARDAAICSGATALVDPRQPGDSNQAMMELGATVCLPRAPLCLPCPLLPWCQTRGEHQTVRRAPPVRREAVYAFAEQEGAVLLEQRSRDASLMAAMWELPLLPEGEGGAELLLQLRHGITVTSYAVSVVRPRSETIPILAEKGSWVPFARAMQLPLTGLARKVLLRLLGGQGSSSRTARNGPAS